MVTLPGVLFKEAASSDGLRAGHCPVFLFCALNIRETREPKAQGGAVTPSTEDRTVRTEMAAAPDLRDELNCSICLHVFSDPVLLSCGHNFCRVCIGNVLDTQDGAGVYTCPKCRAEFQECPALQRNMKLCNIAEHFSLQSERTEPAILCIYCVQDPVPAVKTCVHCETSLCDVHLEAHNKSLEHVLTEPTVFMRKKKCSLHNEALKYYCTQDAVCVCVSCCLAGEHKKHDVELLNEFSEKKKDDLRRIVGKLNSKKQEIEKRDQNLSLLENKVKSKAAEITKRVSTLLGGIREQVDALEKKVLSEISRQSEKISLQISDLMKQQEMNKKELAGKIHRIEELCQITDPVTISQGWEIHGVDDGPDVEDDVQFPEIETVDEDLISVNLYSGLADIMLDIKKRSCVGNVLLDNKTAHKNVAISPDLKTARYSELELDYPDMPERFLVFHQVLSSESFSNGRHYWEVEVGEKGCWDVGMAYHSIERDGEDSGLGYNQLSWSLSWDEDELSLSIIYDCKRKIWQKTLVQRVGVFLDYDAGRLSFYQVGDLIRHFYTFTTTFAEPVHAMFCITDCAQVRIRL